jgi:hypothetical protein
MWPCDRGVWALRVSGHAHMVCTHSVSGKPVYVEPATAMPAILPEEPYEITFRGACTTLLRP